MFQSPKNYRLSVRTLTRSPTSPQSIATTPLSAPASTSLKDLGEIAGFRPQLPQTQSQCQVSAWTESKLSPKQPIRSQTAHSLGRGQAAKQLNNEQYHFECLNLFKQVHGAGATDLQALCRSLVAGHLTRDEPLPAVDFSAVHMILLESLTAMATSDGGALPPRPLREN